MPRKTNRRNQPGRDGTPGRPRASRDRAPAAPWVRLALAVGAHVVLALSASAPQAHHGGDNAAYLALGHSLVQDGAYRELWTPGQPEHSRYPPLYPAFLAAMILAGAKTWSAFKALSLAFTTLATAFCFLWARRLGGDRAALVVALLFGASYGMIHAAQWILSEPLFVAVTCGSLWLLAPKPGSDAPRRQALAVGLILAAAAYFTRTAGAPVVAAAALWLAMGRRWKELGVFAAAFAAVALPWHGRSGGGYVSEFWMINPYSPTLGQVGPWELAVRVANNAWSYVADYLPDAVAGASGGVAAAVGVAMAAAALAGWLRRVRSGPGVGEIFVGLYVCLMLAWPSQGASVRFVLPVLPLVLLYGYESVAWLAAALTKRAPGPSSLLAARWRRPAGIAALAVVVAVPAGMSWTRLESTSRICRQATAALGPWGCYGANIRAFQAMALWARDHLPEGSAVFSRKPRLFYAFSGVPSAVFPFEVNQARFFAMADSLGINHFLRSNWDGREDRFVGPVIAAHPERFCVVADFQDPTESISILAIRPPGDEEAVDPAQPGSVEGTVLSECRAEGSSRPPSQACMALMTLPFLTDRSAGWCSRPDFSP